MLIGVLIRGECEQPGRSIYKLEQSILKIFKFSNSWRLQDYRAGLDNVLVFFSEKMVQSAAIKRGQLTNRKHTYFFFFALAHPTIYRPKSKFLIYSTQAAAVLRYHLFLTMTAGCVRQLICSAHDRISEKVNLKVCCFESSKQKPKCERLISSVF